MARYFFNLHTDNDVHPDDIGTDFADVEEVRKAAQGFLPDVARDEIPRDGDRRTFVVLVTGDDGRPVYSATLNYAGLWLNRRND